MPVSIIFNLYSEREQPIPRGLNGLLLPLLLNKIRAADAQLAQALHAKDQLRPFSISPLLGKYKRRKLLAGHLYWFRVCLLDTALEEVMRTTIGQIDRQYDQWHTFQLGNCQLILHSIHLGQVHDYGIEQPWAGMESYEHMLQQTLPRTVTLRLASPMAFSIGNVHLAFPLPTLMFNSLLKRWNCFAPTELEQFSPTELDNIMISNYKLHTEQYAVIHGGTVIGAKGEFSLTFREEAQQDSRLAALMRFIFYAGLGVKTTQGMGMCRVVRSKS